jgi:hypothetical protein
VPGLLIARSPPAGQFTADSIKVPLRLMTGVDAGSKSPFFFHPFCCSSYCRAEIVSTSNNKKRRVVVETLP